MSSRKDHWTRHVLALESSGLSRAEFCRRRSLNYQTMSGWVQRLAEEAMADDQAAADNQATADDESLSDDRALPFVELPMSVGATAGYEVLLGGGRSIRVGADFDNRALTRLIQVVEAC